VADELKINLRAFEHIFESVSRSNGRKMCKKLFCFPLFDGALSGRVKPEMVFEDKIVCGESLR
jgi:hypothetical protein